MYGRTVRKGDEVQSRHHQESLPALDEQKQRKPKEKQKRESFVQPIRRDLRQAIDEHMELQKHFRRAPLAIERKKEEGGGGRVCVYHNMYSRTNTQSQAFAQTNTQKRSYRHPLSYMVKEDVGCDAEEVEQERNKVWVAERRERDRCN